MPASFRTSKRLGSDETALLLKSSRKCLANLLELSTREGSRYTWDLESDESNVSVYRVRRSKKPSSKWSNVFSKTSPNTPEPIMYCAVTQVSGTLEEVVDMFHGNMNDSAEMKNLHKQLHPHLLDMQVLKTLEAPTEYNPMHSVQLIWQAYNMSPSALFRPRDFCLLQAQDEFVSSTGRRGWARSLQSFSSPAYPSLEVSHGGYVRGSIYGSGHLFTESATPGCIDVVAVMCMDPKSNMPTWTQCMNIKRHVNNLHVLNDILHDRRMNAEGFLGDLDLVPKQSVASCFVCRKAFHLLSRKIHCRKCGVVVCSKCTQERNATLDKQGHTKLDVCIVCCDTAKYRPSTSSSERGSVQSGIKARFSNLRSPVQSPCGSSPSSGTMSSLSSQRSDNRFAKTPTRPSSARSQQATYFGMNPKHGTRAVLVH
ncbi:hypothetical protein THRCLA_03399 [Thraustotheca clavata]|uniref:FYVE-type domain-containing protein n=1 Tax=Thraustotheca clavata TaxID=74557 RepID=A0A1W0A249_9STRA|nr:hypothetical protein THRCLA_03399 [Thraustotheca clavata]